MIPLLLTAVLAHTFEPEITHTKDVIYGRKAGVVLTFDVFQPAKPNGAGILYIHSAGFASSHDAIQPSRYRRLLQSGYTVFAVVHGSTPHFSLAEIEADLHRAVRFIRQQASVYRIDPDRLGTLGFSAGGHAALTLAVKGKAGDTKAKDPLDRLSSEVQAAVAFFPPTDFLNYGSANRQAPWTIPLVRMKTSPGDPAHSLTEQTRLLREASPIYFVHAKQAPILILQGDKDYGVPLEQARSFQKQSEAAKATCELIIKEGQGHGWPKMEEDLVTAIEWFDRHLQGKATQKK
jgi:acetyl esterase/lipase